MVRKTILPLIILFFCLTLANAQSVKESRVILPAGPQYSASGWKQFWWGKHWRDEWLKSVSFPVFNLDTTAGGLSAIKRGGGHETKTLRLLAGNGREYVLRTIDKNLEVLIPDEYKGTFINDIVNDQISTAHPYGPLVVASLSESINIMHTNPVIVFVPDNPRLGEFGVDFAGKLCLFEERPSGDGWEGQSLTGYSSAVVNTEKLLEKVRADGRKKVDQSAFLKVRLFDMLVNDWDRHEDQWIWAEFKQGAFSSFKPFARDRDQSFSKTDGLNLFLLSRPWAIRSLQNFDPTLRDVIGSNLSATALDRQFLNELSEEQWTDSIQSLQKQLPDSVLKKAIQSMPGAIAAISGPYIFTRLLQRRDNMIHYGMKYYRVLNREVTITGSDRKERFLINRPGRKTTEVLILTGKEQQNGNDTLYKRSFTKSTTKSITLYGLGDEDEFSFTGRKKNRIILRVLGGDGKDIYDLTKLESRNGKRFVIYDSLSDYNRSTWKIFRVKADTSFTNYNRRSFRYDWWLPLIIPGYNPEDGVLVGLGFTYKKQLWGKHPFGWQQTLGGNYAASTGAYSLYYKGLFKQVFGQWDADIQINYRAPTYVINFYGYGNETTLSENPKTYFRSKASDFSFNPGISRSWQHHYFGASPFYSTVRVKRSENKFVDIPQPGVDSSVYTTSHLTGAGIHYRFSTTENLKYPVSGFYFDAASTYSIQLNKNKQDYVQLKPAFVFYYTLFNKITIAHRTGAAVNWGEYEFYQANSIGGLTNLRGYWRDRFTGQTSFYQNTDLRWKIADFRGYIVRGSFGVYGFFDDGRVWFRSESSGKLHTSWGGGLFFIPYQALALNLSFASSRESNLIVLRTGFLF